MSPSCDFCPFQIEWSGCNKFTSLNLLEMRSQLGALGLERESILCEQVLMAAKDQGGFVDGVMDFFTEQDLDEVEWDLQIMKMCLDEEIELVGRAFNRT